MKKATGVTKTNVSLLVILILTFWLSTVISAATITVTTVQDNVAGSLRAAITQANTNGQRNTIILPAGTYILTGTPGEDANATGDLDLLSENILVIQGEGENETIIDGNGIDRVFHIIAGDVYIAGVTIRNGKAKNSDTYGVDGESGGGIYNDAVLELNQCSITGNRCGDGIESTYRPFGEYCPSSGGSGGGIYNTNLLTVQDCTLSENEAGKCGGSFKYCSNSPSGGHGGGIYNSVTGVMDLYRTNIHHNKTGRGYDGDHEDDLNNNGGSGGGIYSHGTQTLSNCEISYNHTEPGGYAKNCYSNCKEYLGRSGSGGGICTDGETHLDYCIIKGNYTGTSPYSKIDEGEGGGICIGYTTMTLSNSVIEENYTGNGGEGGGLLVNRAPSVIERCSIINNHAGDGHNDGGDGGDGGGIFSPTYSLMIRSCTVSGNRAGNGADSQTGSGGGGGSGGGLFIDNGGHVLDSTVVNNSAGKAGKTYNPSEASDGWEGHGGGIHAILEDLKVGNTIIANNHVPEGGTGSDFGGFLYSLGYNLIKDTSGCMMNGDMKGCQFGVDPMLGPLADNGGFTKTHALLLGSPAVDAGKCNNCGKDQRGYQRPYNIPEIPNVSDGSDIGAYEADLSILGIPEINLSKTSLRFGADKAGNTTSPQSVIIDNTGTGTMNWTAQTDAGWLSCTPASGTGFSQITLSVNAAGVQPGTYTGTVTVACPIALNSPQTITVTLTVYTWGVTDPPFGVVDTPAPDIVATGSIGVTGWALDNIGVESVKIYREPVSGEGKSWVFVGNTTFVEGARPDVQTAFPDYPDNYKAGWGYMLLTNFLPGQGNGTFTIHAVAVDKEGNSVNLGSRTIHCDNDNAVKPFGAIDTPPSGGTVSGANYVNFGWALTPLPKTIPIDGSTITVWVDGQPLGHPVYNNYRKDIATLFPQYNNSDGAVGYYYLNTANYSNGVHTIAWSVKDDAGVSEGIGSRYFSIQNGSNRVASSSLSHTANLTTIVPQNLGQNTQVPTELYSSLSLRTGFDTDAPYKEIRPDEQGTIDITVQRLEPLEIRFLDLSLVRLTSPLPVGASLVTEEGETRFRWLPGLAFAGPHRLSFLVQDVSGNFFNKSVVVYIVH